MNTIQSGVIRDPRTEEAKAKDYPHILPGGVSVVWKELDLTKTQLTSQRKQNGSYSCVMQSGASALEKLTGKVISATPYFWRKTYDLPGMFLQDMGDIFYNRFTTTEDLSPSQNQSEAQMNVIKPLTTFLGITGYRIPTVKQIDIIAEAIEAYGQCVLTYESNSAEYFYSSNNTPKYLGGEITFGHGICALAYGLVGGVKTLVCRDSAVAGGITYITEDFHSHRNTGCLYFMGSKDVSVQQDLVQKKITIIKQLIALYQAMINLLK